MFKIASLLVSLLFAVHAVNASSLLTTQIDPLAPTSHKRDALTLPLHTITISTNDLSGSVSFYTNALGMRLTGPVDISDELGTVQRARWQMPANLEYDLYLLKRPSTARKAGAMQIRLLHIKTPQPMIRQAWTAMQLGPFSIGFANSMQSLLDRSIRDLGYDSLNWMGIYSEKLPDSKRRYSIEESIFNTPEHTQVTIIKRGAPLPPLGPVDIKTNMGGPSFASMVVSDMGAWTDLLTEVLGMDLRDRREWRSQGDEGAMDLPDGTDYNVVTFAAKGYGPGGHIVLVEYEKAEMEASKVKPALPNLGMGMWSLPVKDLDEVIKRAKTGGVKIISKPKAWNSPALGSVFSATIEAPNGFPIEIFKRN